MHKFDESIDELLFLGVGFVVSKIVWLGLYSELLNYTVLDHSTVTDSVRTEN